MLEAIPDQNDPSKDAIRAAAEAKAAADQGQWDEARAAMAKAIDGASDNATYHALMAWYTYQCSIQPAFERQRLAEHHLSVALEMDPENVQAHYYQGMIWAGGGNTTRARIALSTALNLNPRFQAAAQALDKLGKDKDSSSQSKEMQQATFVKPRATKAKLVIPLAAATLLLASGGFAALYFTGQPSGASDLAKQLGTTLPLASASRVGSGGQDLHIDVSSAWGKLDKDAQRAEMNNIAKGAAAMGIINVFVYSNSAPVAESHGQTVCVGDCTPQVDGKPAPTNKRPSLKPKKP